MLSIFKILELRNRQELEDLQVPEDPEDLQDLEGFAGTHELELFKKTLSWY